MNSNQIAWNASIADSLSDLVIDAQARDNEVVYLRIIESLNGHGFALLDGPARGEQRDRVADALMDVCSHLGTIVAQSPRGETVEDVRDFSDTDARDDRGYRSRGELTPHTDPPTLIALYCLNAARSGGETAIVNVRAIHDRMHAEAPELLAELFGGWPHWRVAGHSGARVAGPADDLRPVFATHNGHVSCLHYRPFLEMAATATGRVLTSQQVEALDLFDAIANSAELNVRFFLQPGQTIILHNRSVLHARTDYEDWPEHERRRHLLRLWIDAPQLLPVAPEHELGDIFARA